MIYSLKKIILVTIPILFLISCASIKEIPVQTEIQVIEKIVTDTVYVSIPVEVIKEVVPQLDTLSMETSVAKSISYLDTTSKTLKGIMENKPVKLEKEIVYSVRDSIVFRDKPYIVTQETKYIPNWVWLLLIISVGINIAFIYSAFKK